MELGFQINSWESIAAIAAIITATIALLAPICKNLIAYLTSGKRGDESRDEFAFVREHLKENRRQLSFNAYSYHKAKNHDTSFFEIADVPLITIDQWLPDEPIDITNVELIYKPEVKCMIPDKVLKSLTQLLPFDSSNRRFESYSKAIKASKDCPSYFSNNKSYRLIDLDTTEKNKPKMTFTNARYFDHIDIGELLAFEFAKNDKYKGNMMKDNKNAGRKHMGNPLNLTQRPVLPGIITLTIRHEPGVGSSFFMHMRDPAKVAVGMNSYSVIPAGEFQPSTGDVYGEDKDFSFWHNIMREYSEELLGEKEHYRDVGEPVDYDRPPFTHFNKAIEEGKARCYYLGFGFDALSLKGEILTVCIWDADRFDEIFAKMCEYNEEGRIVGIKTKDKKFEGIPFNESMINRYVKENNVTSAGASCLRLAMKHKDKLGL